jgi:hypothetical protein
MGTLPVSAADPVNQERLLNVDKEPGNWLHHHQNYAAHRFSTLKEIDRDNVKNLEPWRAGRHADCRERLSLRHRWMGFGLQDRCAWRPRRAGLEDGSQDGP